MVVEVCESDHTLIILYFETGVVLDILIMSVSKREGGHFQINTKNVCHEVINLGIQSIAYE